MAVRHRFTAEELEYLRRGFKTWRIPELTRNFNAWSGRQLSESQMKSVLDNRNLRAGRGPGVSAGERRAPVWRPEYVAWLREHRGQMPLRRLLDAFAQRWGVRMTKGQVEGACTRYGIPASSAGRFQPGATPWNHGRRWTEQPESVRRTQYQPGNLPASHVPVWTFARHQDYWSVKVADNRDHDDWREVHRLVWETERGPVPPGHVVILIDGDPDHCLDVRNLAAVPRRVLAQLNGAGWGRLTDPEERRTLLTMVQLIDAARARARQLGLSRRQIASTVPGIRWRRAE